MPAKRPAPGLMPQSAVDETAIPAAAPALGNPELRTMADLLAEVAPDWNAELQGVCVDDAAVVVLPESGDDTAGPTYVLSRDTLGYRVDQLHWDRLTEVGQYSELGTAMSAIQQRVGFGLSMAVPPGATRH